MNKALARFLSVFTLVSRFPLKAEFEADYSRADFWIPAVSPLVSLCAAAGAAIAALAFKNALLAALAALAAQYLAFNLFHLDGLLDSADALMGWASRERRLEILKDSRIGSFAFFAGSFSLAFKCALLWTAFSRGPWAAGIVLLAYPLSGRMASATVPLLSAPAREEGLGALMKDFSAKRVGLGFLAAAAPLAAFTLVSGRLAQGISALAAVAAGALAAGIPLAWSYRRKIGGFTGDALGAAVELGELACLALCAFAFGIFA